MGALPIAVRSVIVDELHAVAGSKRGAHLALSLERLDALCEKPPLRIGLSATQKPIETMAGLLMGSRGRKVEIGLATDGVNEVSTGIGLNIVNDCVLVDAGPTRDRDLALELPRSRPEKRRVGKRCG